MFGSKNLDGVTHKNSVVNGKILHDEIELKESFKDTVSFVIRKVK